MKIVSDARGGITNNQTIIVILARQQDLIIIIIEKEKKKEINYKRTCRIVDLAVPADYRESWKKMKRTISTLLGNWKNCGTWKWRLYQL